ncbi:MAG: hypothetical protein JKX76_02705 [Colwellia sp.]|nr:hypothetical protein [Colwellia sp.]
MPSIIIPNYHEVIRHAQPTIVDSNSNKLQGTRLLMAGRHVPGNKTIPPLNADINFSSLPKYKHRKGVKKLAASDLPDNFTWRKTDDTYTNPDDQDDSLLTIENYHYLKQQQIEKYTQAQTGRYLNLNEFSAGQNIGTRPHVIVNPDSDADGIRPESNNSLNPNSLVYNVSFDELAQRVGSSIEDFENRHFLSWVENPSMTLENKPKGYLGIRRGVTGEIEGFTDTTSIPDKSTAAGRAIIRSYMEGPRDQKNCGSCYAESSLSSIGDSFAINGLSVDTNGSMFTPLLSATYAMSCYVSDSLCNGGNPATLIASGVKASGTSGFTRETCQDYSWCDNNSECTSGVDSSGNAVSETSLNDFVPTCGCVYDQDHDVFYVKNVESISTTDDDFTTTVKNHIINNGTVVGGIIIYDNFFPGDYTSTDNPEGVYFENVDYSSNASDYYLSSDPTFEGSHALCIVGYGIAENTKYKYTDSSGKDVSGVGDVPYWYVRNSWGTGWGEGGYYKHAMYPYNSISQFDKIVDVKSTDGTAEAGGIVMYDVDYFESINISKADNLPSKLDQSDDYYKSESLAPDNAGSLTGDSSTSTSTWLWWIFGILLTIILLVIFIYIAKKYQK